MTKKLHLGWFMNFAPPDWESEWASPEVANWADGRFYVDMARSMERACFDFMMIEDTVMVADAYGGEILRPSPRRPVVAARRKSLLIDCARLASERLARLEDPDFGDIA